MNQAKRLVRSRSALASPPTSPSKVRIVQPNLRPPITAFRVARVISPSSSRQRDLNAHLDSNITSPNNSLFEGIDFDDSFQLDHSFSNKSIQTAINKSPSPIRNTRPHSLLTTDIFSISTSIPSPTNFRHFSSTSSSHRRLPPPPPSEYDIDIDNIAAKYLDNMIEPELDIDLSEIPRQPDIIIDSDSEGNDSSSDIEIIQQPSKRAILPPTTTSAPKPTTMKSKSTKEATKGLVVPVGPVKKGYFVKPASLIAAEAVPVSTVTKPKTTRSSKKVLSVLQQKRLDAKEAKIEKLSQKPPFNYQKFTSNQPKLIFTSKESEISTALEEMISKGNTVFGFDLEWPPANRAGIENKTALAQICSNDTILLIHISKLSRSISPSLSRFLLNPKLFKLGVQINGDAKKWKRDFAEEISGLIELSSTALRDGLITMVWWDYKILLGSIWIDFLGKDKGVRCGNWSKALDDSQKQYAADDVYASLQIFLELQSLSGRDLTSYATDFSGSRLNKKALFPTLSKLTLDDSTVSKTTTSTSPLPSNTASAVRRVKTTPSPRQQEAYDAFAAGLSLKEATEKMSISRKVTVLTTVWNLLHYLEISRTELENVNVSDRKVLDLIEELPSSATKDTMLQDFSTFLAKVEKRVETNIEN